MFGIIIFTLGVLSVYAALSLSMAGDCRGSCGPLVQYGQGDYASSYPNLNQRIDTRY